MIGFTANRRLLGVVNASATTALNTSPSATSWRLIRRSPVPRSVVPTTPDSESTPTLELPVLPLTRRLENQCQRGR